MLEILIAAILALCPNYLNKQSATENAEAAMVAAKASGLEPELLLAMAYTESRYNPNALSRIECPKGKCRRVTGVWASETMPPNARPSWFCGVTQVGGNVSWERCREFAHDIKLSYATAAEHLNTWLLVPQCRAKAGDDRLACALTGYGGGFKAIKLGTSTYPYRVMGVARMIKRLTHREKTS